MLHFIANLKHSNFQKRYNVQSVFWEFMKCLGDAEMQSFLSPLWRQP